MDVPRDIFVLVRTVTNLTSAGKTGKWQNLYNDMGDFMFTRGRYDDLTPCSVVGLYQGFEGTLYLHFSCPEDGGSRVLHNTGNVLPHYTAS
jgi:hypothetical protein